MKIWQSVLILCTASSTSKYHALGSTPIKMTIIHEATQLKECDLVFRYTSQALVMQYSLEIINNFLQWFGTGWYRVYFTFPFSPYKAARPHFCNTRKTWQQVMKNGEIIRYHLSWRSSQVVGVMYES